VDPPIQLVIWSTTDQDASEPTPVTAKWSAHQAFEAGFETFKTDNDESSYAWTNVPIPTDYLDTGVAWTLYLKSIYQEDVKCAKNTLIICPDCPNFPDTL